MTKQIYHYWFAWHTILVDTSQVGTVHVELKEPNGNELGYEFSHPEVKRLVEQLQEWLEWGPEEYPS